MFIEIEMAENHDSGVLYTKYQIRNVYVRTDGEKKLKIN